MAKKDKLPIRYVVYDKDTKRPIRQGTCLRKEWGNVQQSLDNSKERAKVLKKLDELDLTPYDIWLGDNPPQMIDPMAQANLGYALRGKTAADAITSVDELDTE